MAFYPIQNSFMAGEISPRMYGRTDTPFYKHGVEFSENFLHLPQGPARFRSGSEFIINARQNGDIRLIPFNTLKSASDLCLELGEDGSARLLSESGVVQLSTSGQLILNNDFTQGSANWSRAGGYTTYEWFGSTTSMDMEIPSWESDWDPSGGGPLHPPVPPALTVPRIWQKLINVAGGGPYHLSVSFPAPTDDIDAGWDPHPVTIKVGTALHASDLYLSTGNYNNSVSAIIAVPAGPLDVYIEFSMDGASAARVPGQVSRILFPQFSSASTGPAEQTGLPWTAAMLPDIQYAQDIFFGMVLVHPNMVPQLVTYTGVNFTVAPLPLVGAPADWTGINYPGAVEIWQSRLWMGGTPDKPTALWASITGTYGNFTTGVNPDDAIELFLPTKGAIKWIRGKQNLLLGTDLHEDIVVSAGPVISSQDATLIRESGYGSAPIQAQDIGDQVVFISRDGSKLRSLNFNFDTQAWLAHDITFFAQGITLPGVLNIAYCRDPDSTIYTLCTDGTMRMCTYDRLQEVMAWSRWRTVGQVKSICATIDTIGTTLWMAVNRGGVNYIEHVPPFVSQTPIFLDSYVTDTAATITTVGPLSTLTIHTGGHLDGYTVAVVVDGTYYGLFPAVAGQVVINWSGPQPMAASIGLPYTGTLRTLPLDGGVMYGSSAGLVKSRNKIFARLLPGSFLPLINGQRPSERDPQTPMNTTAPTADIDNWVINLGWDRYARVTIVMDVPLQCEVAGIFGRAEVVQN